jgi:hypothetical protein
MCQLTHMSKYLSVSTLKSILINGLLILQILLVPLLAGAQQPSDADLDAEGQVAMNQFHDCARAKNAFERESASAQTSPIWLDEVARASECAGNLTSALKYYELELKKLPDTPQLVQKVGELRYKRELQAEQNQAQQAAAEQQRQQALDAQRQQQQQNEMQAEAQRVHEAAKTEAQARLATNVSSLNQLLSGTFTDNSNISNEQVKRTVQSSADCRLIVHEDVKTFSGSKCKYTRNIEVPLNEQLTLSLESGRWINVILPQADVKWQEVGVRTGGPFSDCHYNDRNDNDDQRNVEFILQDTTQVNAVIGVLKDVSLACAP